MQELKKHWGSLLVRGVLAVLFGIIVLVWPGIGLEFLVLLFGAFCLVDGLIALFMSFTYRSWGLILKGVLGVIVGLFFFFYTQQAATIFIMVVGLWAVLSGIFEIFGALFLRKQISNEIFLLLVGVISILFGAVIFVNPIVSGLVFTVVIGIYAIMIGVFQTALALRLHGMSAGSKSKPKKKKK